MLFFLGVKELKELSRMLFFLGVKELKKLKELSQMLFLRS